MLEKSLKKALLSGGGWVSAGKIIGFPTQLAVNAFLARLLSQDDMGLYFLIFSLVHLAALFSVLGMERSIVRIVAEALARNIPQRAIQAVHYVLQFGLLASIIISILLIAGVGDFISQRIFNSVAMGQIIYYPAIWVILLTLQHLIAESFRGFHEIRFATIYNGPIVNLIISVAFGLLLWKHPISNLSILLLIIVLAHAFNLFIAFFTLLKQTSRFIQKQKKWITRSEILKTSWGLYFLNILFFFLTSGHLWLLAYCSSKESVALYGAASRLMILITSTLSIIKLVILPMIGDLYTKKSYREMEAVLRTTATIAGIPSVIALIILISYGKGILSMVYGPGYTAGYPALAVLAIANLINVLTGTPGVLMVMASKEKLMLSFTLISGAIGFTISIFLVGTLDSLGVAVGAGAGIIINNLLMAFFCFKKLSIITLMNFPSRLSFKKVIQE